MLDGSHGTEPTWYFIPETTTSSILPLPAAVVCEKDVDDESVAACVVVLPTPTAIGTPRLRH